MKSLLIVTYVKAGVIEIATKQSEGWSYIKAGF
jgi:intracellular sulfur oxidation DsrE/DsrF family protein